MRAGVPNSPSALGKDGTERSRREKESIAHEWVHFLMEETETKRDQSRQSQKGSGGNASVPNVSAQSVLSEQLPSKGSKEMNGTQSQPSSARRESEL
jgi:hypothetical protein